MSRCWLFTAHTVPLTQHTVQQTTHVTRQARLVMGKRGVGLGAQSPDFPRQSAFIRYPVGLGHFPIPTRLVPDPHGAPLRVL